MTHEITVTKAVKSRNDLDRMHWTGRHKETKQWQELIAYEGFKGKVPRATTKMSVTIIAYRTARIRDDANLRGGCKPVLDALKRLGAIVDDSDTWIEDHYTQAISKQPKTTIILRELEADAEDTKDTK